MTLTGSSSGQLLTLAPLTALTAWNLTVDATATQTITNVTPSYSDATAGAAANISGGFLQFF